MSDEKTPQMFGKALLERSPPLIVSDYVTQGVNNNSSTHRSSWEADKQRQNSVFALPRKDFPIESESMLELTQAEKDALRIVILRCELQQEVYGASHHMNWKKIGLSRVPRMLSEALLKR